MPTSIYEGVQAGTTLVTDPYSQPQNEKFYYKEYGPDYATVDHKTGSAVWNIPANQKPEVVHLGIYAIDSTGIVERHNILIEVDMDEVFYLNAGDNWADVYTSLVPGTGVVFPNGEYNGINNVIGKRDSNVNPAFDNNRRNNVSGTAEKPISIVGEEPGQVIFTGGAGVNITLASNESYAHVNFSGLFVKGGGAISLIGSSNDVNAKPYHNTIKLCMVQGDLDNNLQNFYLSRCRNTLVESCAAWGSGRYKFAAYKCEDNTFSRSISRNDRDASYENETEGRPKGDFMAYSSTGINRVVNCLAIDGDQAEFINKGERVGAFGVPASQGDSYCEFNSCMQLNSKLPLGNVDKQSGVSEGYYDNVYTNTVTDKRLWYSWGLGQMDNCTLWNTSSDYELYSDRSGNYIHTSEGGNFLGMHNCVIHNVSCANPGGTFFIKNVRTGPAVDNPSLERFGIENCNITATRENFIRLINSSGTDAETNTTEIDPTPYALYPTRFEQGPLDGKGHNIQYMELSGREVVPTPIPMWPFPAEDVFRERMKEYTYTGSTFTGEDALSRVSTGVDGTIDGARGFCAPDTNLSKYIWEYYGNEAPEGVTRKFQVTDPVNPPVDPVDPPVEGNGEVVAEFKVISTFIVLEDGTYQLHNQKVEMDRYDDIQTTGILNALQNEFRSYD